MRQGRNQQRIIFKRQDWRYYSTDRTERSRTLQPTAGAGFAWRAPPGENAHFREIGLAKKVRHLRRLLW